MNLALVKAKFLLLDTSKPWNIDLRKGVERVLFALLQCPVCDYFFNLRRGFDLVKTFAACVSIEFARLTDFACFTTSLGIQPYGLPLARFLLHTLLWDTQRTMPFI